MQSGKYLYAKLDDIYTIKMVGKLTYIISPDLDDFLNTLFQKKDFANITIDLTETIEIDSTNLGLLAKITRFMISTYNRKATIISTNNDINRILNSMGFENAFLIFNCPIQNNPAMIELPHLPADEQKRARTILEAHRTLMQLNEKNKEVFQEIVKMMEKELEK